MPNVNIASPIDLFMNEILNVRSQNLASAPPHAAGRFYYDTTLQQLGVSNGSVWTYLTVAGLDLEGVRDAVAAFVRGTGITAVHDDVNDTLTFSITDNSITNVKVASNAAISADKLADGTTNKLLTATERTKLTGVASGATANDTNANLRDRTTHTGTQLASTISDLTSVINAAIAAVVGAAPASLDTLKELSDALGGDANFAATVTSQIAAKANTSSLAAVATTGSYGDLLNKPVTGYAATIGDGTATTFVITHNLNTRDVLINVYSNSADYADLLVGKGRTTVNTVTLTFGTAPTVGQYRVVIGKPLF